MKAPQSNKRTRLNILLNLLGVGVGLSLGFLLRYLQVTPFTLFWVGLGGNLYIRFLTMMILPLATSSIVAGIATLDHVTKRKFGFFLLPVVFINNLISTTVGLCSFYVAFAAGRPANNSSVQLDGGGDYTAIMVTLLRNMVPSNLPAASFQRLIQVDPGEMSNTSPLSIGQQYDVPEFYIKTPNMIGIILICIIFGVVAGMYRKNTMPFLNLCQAMSTICLRVLSALSWIQPVGTVCLTASAIGGVADLRDTFATLGLFLVAMFSAVLLHQVVVLPFIVFLASLRKPYHVLKHGRRALLIAFSTTSSFLAVPEMFHVCTKRLGMGLPEAEIGIPLTILVNTSGVGIYVSIATGLIAHLEGIQFSVSNYLLLGILSVTTMMSIDIVPNGGLSGLLIILTSLGLPTINVGLLAAVEWIADRLRATCTTMSALSCAYSAHRLTQRFTGGVKGGIKDVVMDIVNVDITKDVTIDAQQGLTKFDTKNTETGQTNEVTKDSEKVVTKDVVKED